VPRFRAYGQPRKVTIGHNPPWPETRAQEELANIIYQVKRGIWVPPASKLTPPALGTPAHRLNIAQLSQAYLEHRTTLGKGNKAGQQVALIIEAAGVSDARAFPGHKHVGSQALVATSLLSRVRIDEACSLLVGGVRRSEHILNIPDAKRPTGVREVNIVHGLRPILYAHLDEFRSAAPGDSPVFATRNNTAQSPNNMREDVWYGALERAKALAFKRKPTDNWPAKRTRTSHAGRSSRTCSRSAKARPTSRSRSARPTRRSRLRSTPMSPRAEGTQARC